MIRCLLTSDLHANFTGTTHNKHVKFWKNQPNDLDVVFLAGDLGTVKLRDVEVCLQDYRDFYPDQLTFLVFGNHDYWGLEPLSERQERLSELVHQFRCTHLDASVYSDAENRFRVYGFDGWYQKSRPLSNDHLWMFGGYADFDTLRDKAVADWDLVHQLVQQAEPFEGKNILLTHFPSFSQHKTPAGGPDYEFCGNTAWRYDISRRFDYYLSGHSHRHADFKDGNCRFLNAGSDYDQPKALIFSLD